MVDEPPAQPLPPRYSTWKLHHSRRANLLVKLLIALLTFLAFAALLSWFGLGWTQGLP